MADADAGDDSQGLPPSALASAIVDQAVDALESAAAASSSGFSNSASTPNPQFFALLAALRNERAAPDILPHETAMVDELSHQLAQQKGALDQASKLDLAKNAAVADLYEADLSRVRYFLASYLRARLTKVRGAARLSATRSCRLRETRARAAAAAHARPPRLARVSCADPPLGLAH